MSGRTILLINPQTLRGEREKLITHRTNSLYPITFCNWSKRQSVCLRSFSPLEQLPGAKWFCLVLVGLGAGSHHNSLRHNHFAWTTLPSVNNRPGPSHAEPYVPHFPEDLHNVIYLEGLCRTGFYNIISGSKGDTNACELRTGGWLIYFEHGVI